MNLFRSRGVDVFEAINKGDWQKVKDNVVQGKVGEKREQGACMVTSPGVYIHV